MLEIVRTPTVASDIVSQGYDEHSETLDIEFRATGVFRYFSVPPTVAKEFSTSPSPGKFFLQYIKSRYAWEKPTERSTA